MNEIVLVLVFDVYTASKLQRTIVHTVRYFLSPELILNNQYEEYIFFLREREK